MPTQTTIETGEQHLAHIADLIEQVKAADKLRDDLGDALDLADMAAAKAGTDR